MNAAKVPFDKMDDASRGRRRFFSLIGLMLGSVVLACLTAPAVFNGIVWLRGVVPTWAETLDFPFERVISRLALIYLVVGFIPCLRWAGIESAADFGFTRHSRWRREVFRGWRMGILSIVILILIAWATGAFVWRSASWGRILSRVVTYSIGGILVGVIEEGFFRGGLFGAARKAWPWIPVMIGLSIFFSFVHFIRPQAPEPIEWAAWHSGFGILPHIIHRSGNTWDYMPFAVNLFLIGIALTILYQRHGHIYFIVGVHIGWVMALQVGRMLFRNQHDTLFWVYGTSSSVGRSWTATVMLVAIAVLGATGFFDEPSPKASSQPYLPVS